MSTMERAKNGIIKNDGKGGSVGTLYFSYGTRASRTYWAALEMGLDIDLRHVNLTEGEHKSEYFQRETGGISVVPIFKDESLTMSESVAILLYWVRSQQNPNFQIF